MRQYMCILDVLAQIVSLLLHALLVKYLHVSTVNDKDLLFSTIWYQESIRDQNVKLSRQTQRMTCMLSSTGTSVVLFCSV